MTNPPTIDQIIATVRQLQEGDRVRVLKFALAILESRREKRQKRHQRLRAQEVDSWRIGQ